MDAEDKLEVVGLMVGGVGEEGMMVERKEE